MKHLIISSIALGLLGAVSHAAIYVSTVEVEDDIDWPNYPAQANGNSPLGSYDARALNI